MISKQMKTKISSITILLFFVLIFMSCATHEVKRLEERDPIVKKLEERDSMRVIKNKKTAPVKTSSVPKKDNNN